MRTKCLRGALLNILQGHFTDIRLSNSQQLLCYSNKFWAPYDSELHCITLVYLIDSILYILFQSYAVATLGVV